MDRIDALIGYGVGLLAAVLGQAQADEAGVDWGPYEAALAGNRDRSPQPALTSIFSRIRATIDSPLPKPLAYRPAPLSLQPADFQLLPPEEAPLSPSQKTELWRALRRELDAIGERPAPARLESFHFLCLKYGWGLPCTYGEAGVSLFDQWKTVAALVYATGPDWAAGPASALTLIGSDIPGIQEFVYLITSRGAAKGLRGRSFFLQLLGDAVVRRLLRELGLASANVIYNAGGNFMLLGPGAETFVDGISVAARLDGIQRAVDEALLAAFAGDLALCLAWEGMELPVIGDQRFASHASRRLKEQISQAKRRPFGRVAGDAWEQLFLPQDKPGNRFCEVCRRPLDRNETHERCIYCHGFGDLAQQIGTPGGLWAIGDRPPSGRGESWQEVLWDVSGFWYVYAAPEKLPAANEQLLYTANDTNFVAQGAHGFRLFANVTPRVTAADVKRWQQDDDPEDAEQPVIGTVRTFDQMADVAQGFARVGVLRMDVDNLGRAMVSGLTPRTLAATSALSRMMELFFSGLLNSICAEINQQARLSESGEDRGDRLYVIYAGGDDLFVVGSWDRMPILAAAVQQAFVRYTANNPALHISAGLALEGRNFPLYRAAERAGNAEDAAKEHSRRPKGKVDDVPAADERKAETKNAISFLGLAVKWDEWPVVVARKDEILQVVESGQAARSLIRFLQNIHNQQQAEMARQHKRLLAQGQPLPAEPDYTRYYGAWMWREAYGIAQMRRQLRADTPTDKVTDKVIEGLQMRLLDPENVRYLGLAARWAELLSRKEQADG